ncbi:SH3 domain-containing protein [Streptosporangium sp. NBC_01755]|uniref:SH3 domain-containing protein n=1 Tax=unclassified Streptosporangium TaxID=2632669 RepID=UPI002DD9931E|nr:MULTISPECIES: SH3 domain-containing protein [unclassified Streptosporangium]WSA26522.1 SH3 domain-containing protein [Streptosporangium sp. NBC_01810]WSD02055.1 SH3 domain-containing protein [Streptosporangium sp. NBC_01755]
MTLTAAAGMAVVAVPAQATHVNSAFALAALPAVDAVVIANGVRLRSSPGGATVIGYLYHGDYGQILNPLSTNGWCNFRLGASSASGLPSGTTGWVSCTYLAREDGRKFNGPAVDTLRE